MQISVVIPCYNAERWITGTLDSVAQQSVPAHEVIVIDDGSTDQSLTKIREHPLAPKLLQTERLGPAGARNAGLQAATGDWVAFLDADDWWKPNHLERAKNLVEATDDVIYIAASEHFSINVNRIVSSSDTGPFTEPTHGLEAERYFPLYLKHGLLELSSMVVRADRLQEIGGFDPELRGAEDLDMMLQVVAHHTWAYDPIPSSVYRCNNPESHSRKFAKDPKCLTAKLKTFIKNQPNHAISVGLLSGVSRTTMSKAITDCLPRDRKEIQALTYPYLSNSQKLVFSLANLMPGLYLQLNNLRQKIKGPQYGPRKVIAPDV
jgi:glycosyltransferase involved in cell wall biosynthesis